MKVANRYNPYVCGICGKRRGRGSDHRACAKQNKAMLQQGIKPPEVPWSGADHYNRGEK